MSTGTTQPVLEERGERFAIGSRDRGLVERPGERAVGGRGPIDLGLSRAPDVVQVLGEVGEVGEVAERPYDHHRLLAAEAVEGLLEFLPGRRVLVPAERDRALPDALDEVERGGPFLVAHRVAEQSPEQAHVLAQGVVGFESGGHA